jgi:hypothetical protein
MIYKKICQALPGSPDVSPSSRRAFLESVPIVELAPALRQAAEEFPRRFVAWYHLARWLSPNRALLAEGLRRPSCVFAQLGGVYARSGASAIEAEPIRAANGIHSGFRILRSRTNRR